MIPEDHQESLREIAILEWRRNEAYREIFKIGYFYGKDGVPFDKAWGESYIRNYYENRKRELLGPVEL